MNNNCTTIGRMWILLVALGALLPGSLAAQDKGPNVEQLTLPTKDNVQLSVNFYPGPKSKKTVPVILIHEWDGRGSDMEALALALQAKNCSVIVPDLRGHGNSTVVRIGGKNEKISRNRLKNPLAQMVQFDIETCKSYLMKLNNTGDLNIEMLTVMGAGEGCIVALNWAVQDWSWPVLPNLKQGQDVKSLVLLSPEQGYKGLTVTAAFNHPNVRSLPMMIVVGKKNAGANSRAKAFHRTFSRFRTNPDEKDLYLITLNTSLQGGKMLGKGLNVGPGVAKFVDKVITSYAEEERFAWRDRANPLKD